jgi:TRAP-type mannitol/chloroaromatic compound transport system permease small subunit
MKNMSRIPHYIDTISETTGNLISFLILALMFVVLFEVLMRYAFSLPQRWTPEMSLFLFGSCFALGGAYTLLHRAHVRMDVLFSRWSPRLQALMDIVTFVFFLIFIGVLVWKGWGLAWRAIEFAERSQSAWRPLLWPTKIMVPLGAFLVLLQGVAHLIRDIRTVIGRGSTNER